MSLQEMVLGKLDRCIQKYKAGVLFFAPYTKVNLIRIKGLNVKPEIMEHLEEHRL